MIIQSGNISIRYFKINELYDIDDEPEIVQI